MQRNGNEEPCKAEIYMKRNEKNQKEDKYGSEW